MTMEYHLPPHYVEVTKEEFNSLTGNIPIWRDCYCGGISIKATYYQNREIGAITGDSCAVGIQSNPPEKYWIDPGFFPPA